MHELGDGIAELEERRELIINELNWFAITQGDYFDETAYEDMLLEVQEDIREKGDCIIGLKKECDLLDNAGPCQSSIDLTSKGLVSNDKHTMETVLVVINVILC